MNYQFDAQLKQGKLGEADMDDYFSEWYFIQPATKVQQQIGIDRIFIGKKDGRIITVEYKSDEKAAQTGNIFIETVSVDRTNKKGWAYTSHAQILIYYVPSMGNIYIFSMAEIKMNLPEWCKIYKKKSVPNEGYNTIGLAIPLKKVEPLKTMQLNKVETPK